MQSNEMDLHFKWIKNDIRNLQCKAVTYLLLSLPTIITHEKLHKNVNENMFSFTFLCKFSCICNFGIFVRIFLKFSPICRNDINHFGNFLLSF